MTTPERLGRVAEVLHDHLGCARPAEHWPSCVTIARARGYAEALRPLLDEFAAQDYAAGAASVIAYPEAALRERVAAACRLAEPDHLTPMGARIILAAVRAGRHDARATAPLAASQPERGSEGHRDATSGQGGEA